MAIEGNSTIDALVARLETLTSERLPGTAAPENFNVAAFAEALVNGDNNTATQSPDPMQPTSIDPVPSSTSSPSADEK